MLNYVFCVAALERYCTIDSGKHDSSNVYYININVCDTKFYSNDFENQFYIIYFRCVCRYI